MALALAMQAVQLASTPTTTMRKLALHASALNDAEYTLYTSSLKEIAFADDEPALDVDENDAFYERITIGVREARAWFRGRYAHVGAAIDGILRYFSPNLGPTDALSGTEFFAAMRLVVHAENGAELDKSLVFVQPPSQPATKANPFSQPPLAPPSSHFHNPFVSSASPRSTRSEDGGHKPPLPPRKASSIASPPPRHPRPDRSVSPTKNVAPPVGPKPAHHVTSSLMKQSLQATKVAQTMKKAEEQLEKERMVQVLKRTSGPAIPPPLPSHPPLRSSKVGSVSDGSETGAPPLPIRRGAAARSAKGSDGRSPSPPLSASSLEQVALASTGRKPRSPRSSPGPSTRRSVDLPTARPPMHPDRKPPPPIPGSFDAVYGSEGDLLPTQSQRVYRSRSLHHPTPPTLPTGGNAAPLPPPVRRRRPESIQVLSSEGYGALSSVASAPARGASVTRRSSLSYTKSRESTPSSSESGSVRYPHSASASTSHPSVLQTAPSFAQPLANLQKTISSLQPKLDKARYKAEAGLSRRGFVREGGGDEGAKVGLMHDRDSLVADGGMDSDGDDGRRRGYTLLDS